MIKKLYNPKFLGVVVFLCLFVLVFVFTKTQNLNNLKTKENTKLDSELNSLNINKKLPEWGEV
jgi:hypothetical protein